MAGWTDYMLLAGLAIAWGVGDATFNTQISALLGILYPHDTVRTWSSAVCLLVLTLQHYLTYWCLCELWNSWSSWDEGQFHNTKILFWALCEQEAAFAQWKIWQSAATSAAFFASTHIDLATRLLSLLGVLVASIAAFLVVVLRPDRTHWLKSWKTWDWNSNFTAIWIPTLRIGCVKELNYFATEPLL